MSEPLDLESEPDMEEMRERYFEPTAVYLKAKFEREAAKWDEQIASLINEQLEPPAK